MQTSKHKHDWKTGDCTCCAWCPKCDAESYHGEIIKEGEVEVVRLTPRGWVVLVIIPSFIVLWAVWQVSANLWYVGDSGNILGYCWGTMTECYKGGK
jgi:hypothetical protein